MKIEQPIFNSKDEKYKKLSDLPKEQQANFVSVKNKDGIEDGFITKEASELDRRMEESAVAHNEYGRTLIKEITGKGRLTGRDRLQEEAPEIQRRDIETEEYRRKEEAAWNKFLEATEITIISEEAGEYFGPSICNFLRSVKTESTIEGEAFVFNIEDMIERGTIRPEQLIELFEVKLDSPIFSKGLEFTGKYKDGWEERFGNMLGKKVHVAKQEN